MSNNEHLGRCKWFDERKGYGFITVVSEGPFTGKDVFVHFNDIMPYISKRHVLKEGEYVNMSVKNIDSPEKMQATHVQGVCGGPLMCDTHIMMKKRRETRTSHSD